MVNVFLSKRIIISAFILFSGFLVASGVLLLPHLFGITPATAGQNSQWTQETGAGISAPACGSASTSVTCSGNAPQVTFSWTVTGGTCTTYQNISVWKMPPGYTSYNPNFALLIAYAILNGVVQPGATGNCWSGTYTWTGAAANTTYYWGIAGADDTPPGNYHDVGSGTFTTPNCALPPTASMSANPSTINFGQSATLNWSSTNAASCSIDQGIGSVGTSGSRSVAPTTTTTYTLTCSGSGGSAQASAVVNVIPGDFTLSLGGSAACNSVPLSWTASGGATAYRILKGSPRVDISPYQPYTAQNFTDTTVSQNTTYVYQIEAYNSGGTNRSNAINVTTPYCPPTVSFSGNPTSIFEGQSTTLTWSSSFATSCTASGAWSGAKAVNGIEVVIPSPPPSVTYTLTCTGPGGSTGPQSVIVNITPLALPNWKEIIPR